MDMDKILERLKKQALKKRDEELRERLKGVSTEEIFCRIRAMRGLREKDDAESVAAVNAEFTLLC